MEEQVNVLLKKTDLKGFQNLFATLQLPRKTLKGLFGKSGFYERKRAL